MNLSRRTFGLGLIATLAAPAIIRTPGLVMFVRPQIIRVTDEERYQQLMQQWHEASVIGRDFTREGFIEPVRQNSIIQIRAEMAEIERRMLAATATAAGATNWLENLPQAHPASAFEEVHSRHPTKVMAEQYIHDLGALVRA